MQEARGTAGEELWKNISALSDVIFWEQAGDELTYISEGIAALFGVSAAELMRDPSPWFNRVYTRHRGRHQRAIQACIEHGSYFDVEYRARIPGRGGAWLRDHLMLEPETGRLCGITTLVSEQHQTAERLGFLNKAARMFAESLETDKLMQALASHMAGSLADVCIIELQSDDGVRVTVGSENKRLTAQINAAGPMLLDGRTIPSRLRQGRAILMEKLTPAQLRKVCGPARVRAFGRQAPHSAILAPLSVNRRLLGTVTLLCWDPERDYVARDAELALDVCGRAAVALDHARLFAEAQRREAQLAAENEMKDEFLALISHELRTPLTVIYGASRMLPRIVTSTDETSQQMLEDLRSASERTVGLVDDLMLLARLNLGESPQLEPVAVSPLLREVSLDFMKQYPGRTLTTDDSCMEAVLGSVPYVRQVILNLLANAHKYSPPGAAITLDARREGDDVIFSVTDSGKGVPEEELPHIFDRFYRASTSAGVSGAGMGLAICRRLIEALGGHIWASNNNHHGLRVSFSLPIAYAAPLSS